MYVCNTAEQQSTALDIGLQPQQQQPAIAPAMISLLSYDVDARMRMFGWLNRSTLFIILIPLQTPTIRNSR